MLGRDPHKMVLGFVLGSAVLYVTVLALGTWTVQPMAPPTHRPALEVRLQSRFSEPANVEGASWNNNAKEPSARTAVADVPTRLSPVHNGVPSAIETTPNVAIAEPVESSAASASIVDVPPVVKETSEDGPTPTTEMRSAGPSKKHHSDAPPPKVSRPSCGPKRTPKPRSRPKTLTAARPPKRPPSAQATSSVPPVPILRVSEETYAPQATATATTVDAPLERSPMASDIMGPGATSPTAKPEASPSSLAHATQRADATTTLSPQASQQLKSWVPALLTPRLKYPRLARKRGWSGAVHVQVTLSDDGRVSNTTVVRSSGHRLLVQAALEGLNGVRMLSTRGQRHAPLTLELPVLYQLTDR
jgi:protein TonB